jgi:predicted flap endonuclease-1-like 5' DNA nuclease
LTPVLQQLDAVNGLFLLVVLALAIGIVIAWRAGVRQGRREAQPPRTVGPPPPPVQESRPPLPASTSDAIAEEQSRLVRGLEAEAAGLRQRLDAANAEISHARAEAARYRDLMVEVENNAPPPLLEHAPDDLKLIVGIGPVLERMLHKMGISTYRQIARWSEREIDEIDAKLPEFPGRIRRDAWVTQARALHQSKFGETLPTRER